MGRPRLLAASITVCLALTGCATRTVDRGDQAVEELKLRPAPIPEGAGTAIAGVTPDAPAASSATVAAAPGPPAAPAARSGNERSGASGQGAGTAATPSPQGGNDAVAAPGAPRPASGAAEPPAPVRPSIGVPASTVKIASVGSYSGPFGGLFKPYLQGLQVWVRWANDRDGVNGHPVSLVVADDGGDPARHRSLVQEMVERQRIAAFVMNAESISGRSSVPYLTEKRVPVIGGDFGAAWYYESPMYFPQAPTVPFLTVSVVHSVASRTVPKGLKKLGIVTCVEAQACTDADRIMKEEAAPAGFQFVYQAKASAAQPEFTAECLNLRSAGAEVVLPVLPPIAVTRFADSCARQDYHPVFGIVTSVATEDLLDNRNLDGSPVHSTIFPWTAEDLPAAAEFRAAMKTYAANTTPGGGHAGGWVAAKLFEKAAARLTEPPTSAGALEGLWSLRDDTLGGLTAPLTFPRDKPASGRACWFNLTLRDRRYVADEGARLHCLR